MKLRPTREQILSRLDIDTQTGRVFWKFLKGVSRTDRAFNTRWAGKRAGKHNQRGYIRVKIFGATIMLHEIIWFIATGAWPSKHLDHKDRNRSNCAFENLRLATPGQNVWNIGRRCTNTTGYKGVFRNKKYGYYARITVAGTAMRLGTRLDLLEAAKAYDAAARKYHGEFAVLNFPEAEC